MDQEATGDSVTSVQSRYCATSQTTIPAFNGPETSGSGRNRCCGSAFCCDRFLSDRPGDVETPLFLACVSELETCHCPLPAASNA